MDSLQATYRDDDDDQAEEKSVTELNSEESPASETTGQPPEPASDVAQPPGHDNDGAGEPEPQNGKSGEYELKKEVKLEPEPSNGDALESETPDGNGLSAEPGLQTEPMASDTMSEDEPTASDDTQKSSKRSSNGTVQNDEEEVEEEEDRPPKKQKALSSLTNHIGEQEQQAEGEETPVAKNNATSQKTSSTVKKSKKKNNNVWVTKTTRKGKKKSKTNAQNQVPTEDTVMITPIPRFPDKGDDNPDMKICLSKINKAEKVELSEDRLTAGSTKGYRMVRATRGVVDGAWFFEIKVIKLGDTGHTRLGWSTEKGDLQAPVGYDANSFGYRDIDGSKVHKALREKYGEEGYKEGDVIGFYISLPEGELYAPKKPNYVWFKGQRYREGGIDAKEEPPTVVPGSELSFFKNGVCQGVAFKDLFGARYYPAASMYTLPNQPNCMLKFNFGPDFECFPEDFGGRPIPRPMIEVPYLGIDNRAENGVSEEKKS